MQSLWYTTIPGLHHASGCGCSKLRAVIVCEDSYHELYTHVNPICSTCSVLWSNLLSGSALKNIVTCMHECLVSLASTWWQHYCTIRTLQTFCLCRWETYTQHACYAYGACDRNALTILICTVLLFYLSICYLSHLIITLVMQTRIDPNSSAECWLPLVLMLLVHTATNILPQCLLARAVFVEGRKHLLDLKYNPVLKFLSSEIHTPIKVLSCTRWESTGLPVSTTLNQHVPEIYRRAMPKLETPHVVQVVP